MFPVSLDSFKGARILDVGCWTGGTTLLLAAFAEQVQAIEEVNKYAETVSFLVQSFGLDKIAQAHRLSIYECNQEQFQDRFDLVYFPGVIYHLSDPVLALRILFNSLNVGGEILVESAGIDDAQPICRFEGNAIHRNGRREEMNRGGWNWFLPSPTALGRMMSEAGFSQVQTIWHRGRKRVFAYGRKTAQEGICRAGLSVPDIR